MAPSDGELITRAIEGEAEAFAQLADRHSASLFRYLLRMSGSVEQAEELLQDSLVAAFAARRQYRGTGSVRAWLMTIARNRARNAWRDGERDVVDSAAVQRELAQLPVPNTPEAETLTLELRAEIAAALSALPAASREAVVLRDVEGLSYEEIAGVTGAGEGAARVRVHRGREMLRQLLRPYLAAKTVDAT